MAGECLRGRLVRLEGSEGRLVCRRGECLRGGWSVILLGV